MSKNKKQELWNAVEKWIKEQKISCPETIAQSDRVIESFYEFAEEICNIVGYDETEEE